MPIKTFVRVIVRGSSMEPTFHQGDRLLVSSVPYWFKNPRKGDVIVLSHPFKRETYLVKRIEQVRHNGCLVKGDNVGESEDSNSFGAIAKEQIIGKVVFRYF